MHPIKLPNQDYIIPEGHNLCISPFITHLDDTYYDEPNKYKPERWLKSGEDSLTERSKEFIAWGRGPHGKFCNSIPSHTMEQCCVTLPQ